MSWTLTERLYVYRQPDGRWLVEAVHLGGVHTETWKTWGSALNCALAIARTSDWRLPPQGEDFSPRAL